MEFCRQIWESIRWKRLIIYPLRRKACNLTGRERETLKRPFLINLAIDACYEFKEKPCDLLRLKSQTVR